MLFLCGTGCILCNEPILKGNNVIPLRLDRKRWTNGRIIPTIECLSPHQKEQYYVIPGPGVLTKKLTSSFLALHRHPTMATTEYNKGIDDGKKCANKFISTTKDSPENDFNWNFPFTIQPGHVFFGSSIPLCFGAYLGFARQIRIYKKEAAAEAAADALNTINTVITTQGKVMTGRALTIATMSSFGSFALIGAGESKTLFLRLVLKLVVYI